MTLDAGVLGIHWSLALIVAVNVAMIGFVFGSAYKSAYDDARTAWVVGENRRLATALRMLYEGTGYEYPADLDETDEPQPGRWERLLLWLRGVREETPAEPGNPIDLTDEEFAEFMEATGHPIKAEDRDWRTDTGPIVMPPLPGPETVPSHAAITPQAVVGDEWERKSKAMLAEFEARMKELR